jgi:hypothetical protein
LLLTRERGSLSYSTLILDYKAIKMASYEAFEDDMSVKKPIEDQIQSFLNFAQEHETLLREIENATRDAIVNASEGHYRPIRMVAEPPERVFPQDIIITDNDLLHKVLTVLVFLCDEIHELNEMARNKLFVPLIMFGQRPADTSSADDDSDRNDGRKEKMMGTVLPLLQEISNFVDRCYSVSINLVQQLSSLISGKEQLYRSSFQKVRMDKVSTWFSRLFANDRARSSPASASC